MAKKPTRNKAVTGYQVDVTETSKPGVKDASGIFTDLYVHPWYRVVFTNKGRADELADYHLSKGDDVVITEVTITIDVAGNDDGLDPAITQAIKDAVSTCVREAIRKESMPGGVIHRQQHECHPRPWHYSDAKGEPFAISDGAVFGDLINTQAKPSKKEG